MFVPGISSPVGFIHCIWNVMVNMVNIYHKNIQITKLSCKFKSKYMIEGLKVE